MRGNDSTLAHGWRHFADFHSRLRPPLRPAPSDVETFRHCLAGADRLLLLGVTPELAVLGKDLTAVDNSPRMLAAVWPGDREGRRAIVADWTDLPFADGSFDAVIGDASLNAAAEQVDEVVAEARRVVAPGGKVIFRLFCSPEVPETLESIRADLAAGWRGNLHALKWRIAMALAASKPGGILPVKDILSVFDRLFPDRARLAVETGWPEDDIATLDAYVGAGHSLGLPTLAGFRSALQRHFPDVTVAPSRGYPLAERCPVIICRR
jgi:SAM-dependent methyltransferase